MRSIWSLLRKNFCGLLPELFLLAGVLIFAYQLTYQSGAGGFFAFDQSIIFDGSYRILSGQIPYKDFVIPFGPVTFWLQALMFRLLGLSYAVYIFGAAFFNVLAAGCSFYLLRLLFPQARWIAYLGSLFTSAWFYAPFGTPWPEQTAFFFGLLTFASLLTGLLKTQFSPKLKRGFYFMGGLLAFTAFMSKQNAGALIFPVGAALFFTTHPKNFRHNIADAAVFFAGWVAGAIAFGAWLYARSDPGLFLQHFLIIPALEGGERIPKSLLDWASTLFIGAQPPTILRFSLLLPFSILVLFIFERASGQRGMQTHPNRWVAGILAISLFVYQNLFLVTSNNQLENSIPFTGLIAAIGVGLLWPWAENITRKSLNLTQIVRGIMSVALFGLMAFMFRYGVEVSFSRQVHSIFKEATFPNHLASGKLSAIQWGVLNHTGPQITADEINQLVEYLETRQENFFIFPDFTILYGIIGVPSPQPLLWFHRGLTYPHPNDPALDAWVVSSLDQHHVQIIVIETESWFDTDKRLSDFPQLQAYIKDHFNLDQRIGEFLIYTHVE